MSLLDIKIVYDQSRVDSDMRRRLDSHGSHNRTVQVHSDAFAEKVKPEITGRQHHKRDVDP